MIIGLCGAIQAGKSTCANYLCNNYQGYKQYSFADSLKESCALAHSEISKEEFGWNGTNWTGPKTEQGRIILQDHGQSERDKNPNCWLDVVAKKVKEDHPDIAIVGDSRHINELQWVIDNDGLILYVSREAKEQEFIEDYLLSSKIHQSESSWRLWLIKNINFMTPLRQINSMTILSLIDNNEDFSFLHDQLSELDYKLQAMCEKVY